VQIVAGTGAPVVAISVQFITAGTAGVAATVAGQAGATYSCSATGGTITAGAIGTIPTPARPR